MHDMVGLGIDVGIGLTVLVLAIIAQDQGQRIARLSELGESLWDRTLVRLYTQDRRLLTDRARINTLERELAELRDRVALATEWLVSCRDKTGTVTRCDVDGSWSCGCGFGEDRIEGLGSTPYEAILLWKLRVHAAAADSAEEAREELLGDRNPWTLEAIGKKLTRIP
jgi:hypothetical protein